MATGTAGATKARILAAARDEFAAYGIAGARVDRIATAAGCNKNLLYVYFGNKEALFATVLEQSLRAVYSELPFTPDDLPGYAARVFSFAMANPDVMRLLAWSSLEQEAAAVAVRRASQDAKVAGLDAGAAGGRFPPRFLLTAVMALATAWSAASPFGRLSPELAADPDALGAMVAAAAAALAAPA